MRYDAILIDADDTIFDFHAAEREAIAGVIQRFGIQDPDAPRVYHRVNQACWDLFEKGLLSQDALRVKRFRDFLEHYGLKNDPEEAGEQFVEELSRQRMLLPGAQEVIAEIAGRLPVAIVTNGIASVQHGRIDGSPIKQYISALVISGEQGFQKPDPRMIYRALEMLGDIEPSRALMVGDSLTSDIRAANLAGVDACWYNPEGKVAPAEYAIRYELGDIRKLSEIALEA